MSLVDRVRALLGDDAVDVAATPDGVPRVAPGSPDAVGLLLGTAREEGWRVRVEGAGTWLPADAPADLALTTRRLDKIPAIEPQDLSATAEAGIGCDLLRQQLAAGGFGAFGVIVLVHLRLRALPRADQTLVLEGSREDLTQVADDIAAAA